METLRPFCKFLSRDNMFTEVPSFGEGMEAVGRREVMKYINFIIIIKYM